MASGFGFSANTTKQNFYKGQDTEVVVALKNDNSYPTGGNLTPQRYYNGAWHSLDYDSPNPLKPEQTGKDRWDIDSILSTKGTYRFKVSVDRYDNELDYVSHIGTFYTDKFYIK